MTKVVKSEGRLHTAHTKKCVLCKLFTSDMAGHGSNTVMIHRLKRKHIRVGHKEEGRTTTVKVTTIPHWFCFEVRKCNGSLSGRLTDMKSSLS